VPSRSLPLCRWAACCGNGKYLGEGLAPRWEVGADYSANLLGIVRGRGHQAVRCDLLAVPLRDSAAAGVICIAALHHLASEDRRAAALAEMARVLAPGGRGLVYVWAKDQRKLEALSYLKQNKKNFTAGAKAPVGAVSGQETGQFGLPVYVNRSGSFSGAHHQGLARTQFQHQDNLVPWKLKKPDTEGGDQVAAWLPPAPALPLAGVHALLPRV
jgi:alkylated DNA repair protein alkB family protein 8